jgi:hypothetical protein
LLCPRSKSPAAGGSMSGAVCDAEAAYRCSP